MKPTLRTLTIIITVFALFGAFGCGANDNMPTAPSADANNAQADVTSSQNPDGWAVMGAYHLTFDRETGELTSVEVRDAQKHFNLSELMVTQWGQQHVSLEYPWKDWNNDTKTLLMSVKLQNLTQLTAYDVRGILIFPPYSSDYLRNPDDYTMHWNPVCDEYISGFLAFNGNSDVREFKPMASYEEVYEIGVNTPPGMVIEMDLVFECSFPGNCSDPYEITDQYVSNPITWGLPATITVAVGVHNGGIAQSVYVETNMFSGDVTHLTWLGGPWWTGTINYTQPVPPGTYGCRIVADTYYGSAQNYVWEQLYDFVYVQTF